MDNTTPLKEYSPEEKTAYLQAIASLATADRSASTEELEYLTALSAEAGLSPAETEAILESAREAREDSLSISLNVLKASNLRFSLMAELIQFAESDQEYSVEEKASVEKIASYLNVDRSQYEAISEFVDHSKQQNVTSPSESTASSFGTGISDKLKAAGIDVGSLTKGLIATLAPLILAKVMGRRSGSSSSGLRGGLGSLISGLGAGSAGRGKGGLFGNILSQLGR